MKKFPRLNQFTLSLIAILMVLQFSLWIGRGSVFHLLYVLYEIHEVKVDNADTKTANDLLYTDVLLLKNSPSELESRARYQLGMAKNDELYYQVLSP